MMFFTYVTILLTAAIRNEIYRLFACIWQNSIILDAFKILNSMLVNISRENFSQMTIDS